MPYTPWNFHAFEFDVSQTSQPKTMESNLENGAELIEQSEIGG